MKNIYLVVAVPAAGKSWVCDKLKDRFECVHHDNFIHLKAPGTYFNAVLDAAKTATRPLLIEAPFSISGIKDPLEKKGFKVTPVFIFADEQVLRKRYTERGRTEEHIISGHLSRQKTFQERARKWRAFSGTSTEVLAHLTELPL